MALTERELYHRIMDVMKDDADVVQFCEKKLAHIEKSGKKTENRIDITNQVLSRYAYCEEEAKTARGFARIVNSLSTEENWNTRTASYYLSRMVKEGTVMRINGSKGEAAKYYLI